MLELSYQGLTALPLAPICCWHCSPNKAEDDQLFIQEKEKEVVLLWRTQCTTDMIQIWTIKLTNMLSYQLFQLSIQGCYLRDLWENLIWGGKGMQDLMVDSVRMKKRRRNSAQSKVLCRPVREKVSNSVWALLLIPRVWTLDYSLVRQFHPQRNSGTSPTAQHLLSCDQ